MGKVTPPNIPRPKSQVRKVPHLEFSHVITDNEGNIIIKEDNANNINFKLDFTPMRNKPSVAQAIFESIADMVNADYNSATKVTRHNPTYRTDNRKVENRFTLPKEMFEAVDFSDMGVIEESKDSMPNFIVGENYALRGVSCEGFEMPEKVYKLVALHDEFDGIALNSLIVKQISGDQDKIFTLSKNDCDHIGIEYEKGLQLFPKHLNWKRVKEIVPFNKADLGTSPLSDVDNTIRYILLRLDGFKDYENGFVVTPSGRLIKEDRFAQTLRIISNEPIVYYRDERGQQFAKPERTPLNIKLVYPKTLKYNHGNFISNDDTVYVLITLAERTTLESSIDGYSGVPKMFLEGFNPNDHFSISWDELGTYTVEEYELEKAKKEQARLERIAREEAETKKRIAEEEKRIREQRRRTEEAVARMKNYHIDVPQFPKFPNFNMENGLSSLNLYMDGLDIYFDSLDTSLSKLSKDLSQMSREIGINIDKRISKNLSNSTLFNMFKL